MVNGKDEVWIGNLGKYNEGSLTGAWLELPYDEDALGDWLRDHVGIGELRWDGGVYEETYIGDTDFCGRLGDLGAGKLVGSWTSLRLVNAAAQIAGSLRENALESVRAYVEADGVSSLEDLCNVMLQADEILAYLLREKLWYYGSPEKAVARNIDVAEAFCVDDEVMRKYISAEAVGEAVGQGGCFSGDVWLDTVATPDLALETCREDVIAGEAYGGLSAAAKAAGARDEDVVWMAQDFLKSCGFFGEAKYGAIDAMASSDPELLVACANTIADTADYGNEDAVGAYVENCLPASYGPAEVAAVVQGAGELVFRELEPGRAKSDAVKLGEAVIEEWGTASFSHEDLTEYFDEEGYAHDLITVGDITVTDGFIMDNNATCVDLDKYDLDEILAEGADRARMCSRASEIEGSVRAAQALDGKDAGAR